MNILINNLLIIGLICFVNLCYADTLNLVSTKKKILKVEKQFEFKKQSIPEFETLRILDIAV